MRTIEFVGGRDNWQSGLLKARHFSVDLIPNEFDVRASLPVHERVLRPLLQLATSCYAYELSKRWTDPKKGGSVFIKEGRRYRVDLSQEVIRGHEYFWNSGRDARGNIIILADDVTPEQLRPILRFCYSPIFFTVTQLKRNETTAAIRACLEHGQQGAVALSLGSIERLEVFAPPDRLVELFEAATEECEVHPFHFHLFMEQPASQWPRWMRDAVDEARAADGFEPPETQDEPPQIAMPKRYPKAAHDKAIAAMLIKPNRAEAIQWLNDEPAQRRAVGHQPTREDSLRAVQHLYNLGARNVTAVEIREESGAQRAEFLVVLLPNDPKQREELFRWINRTEEKLGIPPTPDWGQPQVLVVI